MVSQVESKKVKLIETVSKISVSRDGKWLKEGGSSWAGEIMIKGYKASVTILISSGDLMCSVVTIVNNTILHISNLPRE